MDEILSYAAFREQFAAAMDPRFYNIEWLDDLIETGAAVFIGVGNSAIVVTVRLYPTGIKELYGMFAAGDVKDIVRELIPIAEALGRELGCEVATIESREAWQRLLNDYETYKVVIQKRL